MHSTAEKSLSLSSSDVEFDKIEAIVEAMTPTEREEYINSKTSEGAIAIEWLIKVARIKYPSDEDLVKKVIYLYSPHSAAEKLYTDWYPKLFELLSQLENKSEIAFINDEPDPVKNTQLIKVLIKLPQYKAANRAVSVIAEAVEMLESELTTASEAFNQMKLFIEALQKN